MRGTTRSLPILLMGSRPGARLVGPPSTYMVILLERISLLLATVPPHWRDVKHTRAELDERAPAARAKTRRTSLERMIARQTMQTEHDGGG